MGDKIGWSMFGIIIIILIIGAVAFRLYGTKIKDLNLKGNNNNAKKEEGKFEGKNPIVTIEMEDGGIIKVELYPDIAPNTVANFVNLVNDGFYDNLTFHRTIPGFMIQGGDPKGDGTGGPGYGIAGEFNANGVTNSLKHKRGVISMARSKSYNSAGSQFFIMVAENASLDGLYASFGEVIEGMDIVDQIVNNEVVTRIQGDPEVDRPINPPVIKNMIVETFGEEYKVEKVTKSS